MSILISQIGVHDSVMETMTSGMNSSRILPLTAITLFQRRMVHRSQSLVTQDLRTTNTIQSRGQVWQLLLHQGSLPSCWKLIPPLRLKKSRIFYGTVPNKGEILTTNPCQKGGMISTDLESSMQRVPSIQLRESPATTVL